MSKKKNQLKLEEKVMSQVKTGKIVMKSKWYFAVGSLLLFSGLVSLSVGAIFLINLTIFTLRKRGPVTCWRLQAMIENFPWWVPVLAVIGMILGIRLLKQYDFSYKKNFKLIIVSFILAVVLAGFLIDKLGLNDYWAKRGLMKRFYQKFELRNSFKGSGNNTGKFFRQTGPN